MRRPAVIVPLAVLGLLLVVQLALPWAAERKIRSDLGDMADIESVDVGAFPAIELLWGHADSVDVRLRSYEAGVGDLADDLGRTKDAGRIDVHADGVKVGPLVVRDASLTKRGDILRGSASVTDGDLRAALPAGFDVRPVAAADGQLVFEGTAALLGISARIRARAFADRGRLVVQPEGIPLGELVSLTIFDDDRVAVESLGSRAIPSGGYTLTAAARLR